VLSFRHPDVEAEFERWLQLTKDEKAGWGFGLSLEDVLAVHFLIVDIFYGSREGLGGIGPKDVGLLSSAVSRQFSSFGGVDKWITLEEKVATLLYGIVLNHPFHDANKRTAFLTTLYYLQKEGRFPRITAKQFEDFVVKIADKSFLKMEKYQRSFAEHEDGDIRFIAHFLRSSTRQIDKRDYTITFNDLNRILTGFGYALSNPSGNYIDIVYTEGRNAGHKVCQIGFPSWTKQVTRQAIKTVRQATGLTVLKGVDSQVFFKDVDPISQLLAKYYDPLQRLADR
jgi:prophage maintenance system killer protein